MDSQLGRDLKTGSNRRRVKLGVLTSNDLANGRVS
jgi:hypothetical protein